MVWIKTKSSVKRGGGMHANVIIGVVCEARVGGCQSFGIGAGDICNAGIQHLVIGSTDKWQCFSLGNFDIVIIHIHFTINFR